MTSVDTTLHALQPAATVSSPSLAATSTPGVNTGDSDDGSLTFDDVLDIVNPLQHFPVVSTLYRAVTGDQIKTFPKIAGDTLYGGWMGFASSMADTIFQKITGKGFGDTALAMAEDIFKPSASEPATAVADAATATATTSEAAPVTPVQVATLAPIDTTATPVASNAPALTAPAGMASLDAIVVPGHDALVAALSRNGVAPDSALRAVDAYRRSAGVATAAAEPPAVLRTSLTQ